MMIEKEIALTEEEKIMILDQLLEQCSQQLPLKISRNEEMVTSHNVPNVVYTYNIMGSEHSRKTQNNNLIQKISDFTKQEQKKVNEEDIEVEQQNENNHLDFYRYFKDNIRCFRCKKVGHYNYACLNEFNCMFCLASDHPSDRCPQKTVCYQCYRQGHVISECKSEPGAYCQNCKRKHSQNCNFLMKGIESVKQLFNIEYLHNDPAIRCMRCFNYGHMICNKSEYN